MIRIAYIINSLEGGGAAFPVPAIITALKELGAEVKLFALTRRDGRALAALEAAGIEVAVREGGEKDHFAALRWMIAETRRWGATHAISSLSRATLLALLGRRQLGVPVASWQHAAFLRPRNYRYLRLLSRRAKFWITDSEAVAEWTATHLNVGTDRIEVWPMFSVGEDWPQAAPWQMGEPLRLASLGRLHPVKGYAELVEALGLLKARGFAPPVPYSITIGGEGAQRAELEARIAALGINTLHLPGFVEDPAAFLTQHHLYLQPSRSEGFCIAAHQALAAGLPVLASSVGQLAFTIRDGDNGLRVPPRDPMALADGLAAMLSHPARLAAMGARARTEMMETYSRDRFAKAAETVFTRLVS